MRKIWIIATAAAAVAFAGCNRETDAPAPEAGVFRATIETPSRVAFSDEGTFSWQEGDAIAVSTNAGFKTFTLASGAGSASGTFQGELVDVTSATVAVYPAAAAKDDATVTLPAEYAWKEGQTNAVMFCEQVSLTEVNSFKHLGGIIKITYSEIPADANALVFKAEAKITGDFAIADGKIAAGAGTDEVKVTFAAGSNPAAFYIPVPTGEYKFSVELQKDGAAVEGTKIATTNPIKVDRKSLILMDPIGGVQAGATIRDFAEEFVKVIDIWEATVGEIKMHSSVDATPNAHYIPDETTITVGDKTYNTADMYETASRCYLLVRGYNGLDTENYGAGKIAALEGGAQAMSTTEIPATHDYTWGSAPYNELGTYDIATGEGTGNNGHLIKIVDGQAVHSQVDVTILDNQVMRALNYSHGKDISNMCTYPRDPITNYAGSFSAKRALLTYAFFFKYMLDNNLDKADGIGADVAIRSELFGDEGPAAPELKTEIATAEDFLSFVDNAKLYAGSDGVKLTADIELPATFEPDTLWCSIDGQGHKVTYTLDIPKESTRSAGLFTNIQDGLTVKDLKVAGSLKSGKAASGGIGGKCASNVTFENCESAVNILGDASGVTYHLGGIAGEIATGAVFRNCHNTGNIVYSIAGLGAGNNTQEGGIVAQINGDCLIENCVNDGIVEFHAGEKAPRIAGICGYVNDATDISFINCINNAEVFAEWKRNSGYAYIGGITGYYGTPKADCKILYSDCVNNGKVYSYGNTNIRCRIGGIAGYAGMTDDNATSQGVSESGTDWKYTNCTNNGEISNTGTNSANHIGGIIGFAERAAKLIIEGCTQNSNISQAGAGRAGGMLGMRGGSQSIYKDIKVTKNVLLEVTGAGDAKLIIGDNDTQIVTEMTGKIEAATVSVNGTATEMTADNYRDFLLKNALGEGGSTEGVVFDGGQPSYPAPFEKIVEGAQLDPTTLPGDWNVRGTSATKNGIYVLGGTGSDPRLVVPVDKSWCWNGTVSNEYDNVLSIAMTGISGTSIQGNMEWKAGADGKFWDYLWILNPSDKPEYAPYANTDLSKFYNKIPKGKYAFTLDLATMTATLNNGEKPKILTPGTYKFCDGVAGQVLEIPDGCFAMKFHLGNMQVQASEWYSKDIDRFMFYPLEYILIFEKE